MKNLTLPVMSKKFIQEQSATVIECNNNGSKVTVWVPGDKQGDTSLLCNIEVHEPGDTFIATKDSKTKDDEGKPLYLKGDTVTRNKQTYEFKSFTGNGQAAQFAQAASAFNLTLQVVMA